MILGLQKSYKHILYILQHTECQNATTNIYFLLMLATAGLLLKVPVFSFWDSIKGDDPIWNKSF
jgi:hypothetical protein